MSVCLMISNPINKNEEAYYVPISTERVFREYWMPIIIDLDLQWIKCFQSGIEIVLIPMPLLNGSAFLSRSKTAEIRLPRPPAVFRRPTAAPPRSHR